jgi:hypothetical protein
VDPPVPYWLHPPPPPPPGTTTKPPPKKLPGPIDRRHTIGIGLRTGALIGGYRGTDAEGHYADLSAGVLLRGRLKTLGFELSFLHGDQRWGSGTTRSQSTFAGSVMFFFAPFRRVQPFVDVGITGDAYRIDDDIGVDGRTVWVTRKGLALGPHLGLGFEFALGKKLALDIEGRVVRYLNLPQGGYQAATQGSLTMGLIAHF